VSGWWRRRRNRTTLVSGWRRGLILDCVPKSAMPRRLTLRLCLRWLLMVPVILSLTTPTMLRLPRLRLRMLLWLPLLRLRMLLWLPLLRLRMLLRLPRLIAVLLPRLIAVRLPLLRLRMLLRLPRLRLRMLLRLPLLRLRMLLRLSRLRLRMLLRLTRLIAVLLPWLVAVLLPTILIIRQRFPRPKPTEHYDIAQPTRQRFTPLGTRKCIHRSSFCRIVNDAGMVVLGEPHSARKTVSSIA
jgi:hypothetical protein